MEDIFIPEFYTRLDDNPDDVAESIMDALLLKLLAVCLQCFFNRFGFRDGDAVFCLLGTAGNGNFRPDNVSRPVFAGMLFQPLLIGLFTGFLKDGTSACNGFIRERLIFRIIR